MDQECVYILRCDSRGEVTLSVHAEEETAYEFACEIIRDELKMAMKVMDDDEEEYTEIEEILRMIEEGKLVDAYGAYDIYMCDQDRYLVDLAIEREEIIRKKRSPVENVIHNLEATTPPREQAVLILEEAVARFSQPDEACLCYDIDWLTEQIGALKERSCAEKQHV